MARTAVHPLWGLLEIALLGGLFVFTLWVVGPHVETSGAALGFYWAAVAIWTTMVAWLSPFVLHRDPPGLRGWGLGRSPDDPGTLRNAWPTYLGFTAAAGLALMVATAVRDPAFAAHTDWPSVGKKLLIYLVWGPFQAAVFFGYVQTRVRTAVTAGVASTWGQRALAVLITAGLFAAAHMPNWPLAALAFATGLCWSWIFYARPNILLVGASHAVLGTVVYSVLKLYTRIGPFYAHPEGHIVRNAIPGLRALVGDLF